MFEAAKATIRWWLVGRYSRKPSGELLRISGRKLAASFGRMKPEAKLDVTDRLGSDQTRAVELAFAKPRSFRPAEVAKQIPEIRSLQKLAGRLKKGEIGVLRAIAGVEAEVGEGRLSRALASLLDPELATAEPAEPAPAEPDAPPDPTPDPKTDATPSGVDAIFAKADVKPAGPVEKAQSGLGAFVSAVRSANPGTVRKVSDRELGRQAAIMIGEAVDATLRDVMLSPEVHDLEVAWRGARTILGSLPTGIDVKVEIVDVPASELTKGIEQRMPSEPEERPDAIFVLYEVTDIDVLGELAAIGSRSQCPVVVGIPGRLCGAEVPLDDSKQDADPPPEQWTALRERPESVWLCAVTNDLALANDTGEGDHLVLGGPAIAVCAMLSEAVERTGAFGDVLGHRGAWTAPAAHDVPDRAGDPMTIPTRWPVSIRTQRRLAQVGVLALGSERNTDQVALAVAPMVIADGERSLPVQIVAGKVMRYSQWVARHSGGGLSPEEIARRFSEAATLFFHRGPAGALTLDAKVGASGAVEIDAGLGSALGGSAARFSFKIEG